MVVAVLARDLAAAAYTHTGMVLHHKRAVTRGAKLSGNHAMWTAA